MSADAALRQLALACGVHLDFHDLTGTRRETPVPTLRALLRALGVEAESGAQVAEALACRQADTADRHLPEEMLLRAGQPTEITLAAPCRWQVVGEDGRELAAGKAETQLTLPPLEVGYASLHLTGEGWREESFLLLRPPHAPLLSETSGHHRSWGVTAALYGLRSGSNGGLGSYDDLAKAAGALGRHGAQFLGINPVSALGWAAEDTISPYSPTHRGFFNADHIAVEGGLGPTPENALIDYKAFRARQRPALEAEYARTATSKDFKAFCAKANASLEDFSCYEAISERHGTDIRQWPAALQQPGPAAIKEAGRRAEFHRWLQWRAEREIDAAQAAARTSGMSLGLYLDLAVGARPGGAEAWMHDDTIARGVTIGAPPDQLSPEGQSWDLVAHAPGRLAQARYTPLRTMLRKLMEKCGLLRIDHALGLMRSYWLPDDGSPGAYVTQPFETLLAVIAIEAHRARCVVVGEDLGLVPDGFRQTMNTAGLYSYAVWQYETFDDGTLHPASDLRPFSLACFSTHDTPTLRGFWYGADVELWRDMGWISDAEAAGRHGHRSHQRAGLRRDCAIAPAAGPEEIAGVIHGALTRSPAAMVAVQLDDLLGQTDAPNLPGTIDEHPNWRRRTGLAVEDFATAPQLAESAATMRTGNRQPPVPAEKGPISCPE
ncbi:4-alpha-glucanotransferase [Marinovum sp.]|uniref:4-alpha-glucanotransferase n=1 Tax=Marinovum sp. TaxID=2024839 RepID=UPI002B26EDE1|nr:4-alpha-glucanotransferase [Marinovum sp.]